MIPPFVLDSAAARARDMFLHREAVMGRSLDCPGDWRKLAAEAVVSAILGERSQDHQLDCVLQAIRIEAWQAGYILKTWTTAFAPVKSRAVEEAAPVVVLVIPRPWYRQYLRSAIGWLQKQLTRLHDLL